MSSANIKCPECPYDKARNLGTHLFFVHGYSKNRISEWRMNMKADTLSRSRDIYDIFRCQFCPKTYKRQNSCRAHERVVHCVSSNMRQKCVPCPIRNCHFTTTALLDLCAHAKERHPHLGDFTIKEARFENMALFQSWRLQYEESTLSVLATESVNNNAAAGTTLRYLRCAQLEAQIRKVRNQLRRAAMRRGDPDSEFEDEEEMERDDPRRAASESSLPPLTSASASRRPVRKRKLGGEDTYGMEEEDYGVSRARRESRETRMKMAKEEKEMDARREEEARRREEREKAREEEEEEIDVEQLDDIDEKPSTSTSSASLAPAERRLPKEAKEQYEEEKEDDAEERAPRLMRASSAHLASDEEPLASDPDDTERMVAEMDKRVNSRHCTAHMRVLVLRTGAVHVEYCESHLGHEVMHIPPVARTDRRAERMSNTAVKPMAAIARDVEEDIEAAKARRKGRRETEHRWRKEKRMRSERDEFDQLCNDYDDIGANVELYEADDAYAEEEEGSELPVEEILEEEVLEEEVVDHEEMVESEDQ